MPSLINKNLTIDENNAVVALVRDAESQGSEEYFLLVESQSDKSRMEYGCYKLQMSQNGKGAQKVIINEKNCHVAMATMVFNNHMLPGKPLQGISWQISAVKLSGLIIQILSASRYPENIPHLPPENPSFFWFCSLLQGLQVPNITNSLPKTAGELPEDITLASRKPDPEERTEQPKSGSCKLM
jgi:hypothetical protein